MAAEYNIKKGQRVLAHVIADHPDRPDSVLYPPQRPWEDWSPRPPGQYRYYNNDARESEITLEVSMRDIIENSKPTAESVHSRYSTESTRTANESGESWNYGNEKGEKALPPPPPAPVGFWDRRLAKTRIEVLKGWLRISQSLVRVVELKLKWNSSNTFRLYSYRAFIILGRSISY